MGMLRNPWEYFWEYPESITLGSETHLDSDGNTWKSIGILMGMLRSSNFGVGKTHLGSHTNTWKSIGILMEILRIGNFGVEKTPGQPREYS